MPYKEDPLEEVREPIAHPHYPVRQPRAARPIYVVVEEDNEGSPDVSGPDAEERR